MRGLFVLFVCAVLSVPTVTAAPKAEELIKYRQSAMTYMRWNLTVMRQQIKAAPAAYDAAQVLKSARRIAAVADGDLLQLFAEGTESGRGWKPTRALPAVFELPEEFETHLNRLRAAADVLIEAAVTEDQSKAAPAVDALFQACRSCHKQFRRAPQ